MAETNTPHDNFCKAALPYLSSKFDEKCSMARKLIASGSDISYVARLVELSIEQKNL